MIILLGVVLRTVRESEYIPTVMATFAIEYKKIGLKKIHDTLFVFLRQNKIKYFLTLNEQLFKFYKKKNHNVF